MELLVTRHRLAAVAADIAEEVRRQRSHRIPAFGGIPDLETGKLFRPLRQDRDHTLVRIAPHDERQRELLPHVSADVALTEGRRTADRLADRLDRAHDLLDRRIPRTPLEAFRQADDGTDDHVVRQDPLVPVEDAAARPVRLDTADRLAGVRIAVRRGIGNLHLGEANGQDEKPGEKARRGCQAGQRGHEVPSLFLNPLHRHPPFSRARPLPRPSRET